tara:strand:- start:98 stop:376 length:279 start_codon:yes stop_codon:yes gene_type:complete
MKLLGKEIIITNHFIERYYERVFKTKPPELTDASESYKKNTLDKVIEDFKDKISDRDKNNLFALFNLDQVKLPFKNHMIVLKNSSMITILNT